MQGDLADVRRRIDWAEQHLLRLDSAIGRYLDGERNVRPVLNYQAGGETVLVEIPALREPPPELPLLIGDVLHNLRSALDHLAWQLVIANGGTPTERTQFPIYESPLGAKGGPRTMEPAGGVVAAAQAVLTRLQPYVRRPKDPHAHTLSILRQLSNVDKHRRLHVIRGETTPPRCALTHGGQTVVLPAVVPPRVTDDNTLIVGRMQIAKGTRLNDDVELELTGSHFVALREALPDTPVILVLQRILKFERRIVVPALAPFLT